MAGLRAWVAEDSAELAPERATARALLAVGRQAQGAPTEALDLLNQAAALNAPEPWMHEARGASLHALGREDAAATAYEQALAVRPSPDALTGLGNVRKAQGRWDDALACHEEALRLAPAHEGVWRNLRLTFIAAGRAGEGFAWMQGHPSRSPFRDEAAAALALAAGLWPEALHYAQTLLRDHPHSVAARMSAASALRELGRPDEALARLREAVALAPNDAEAHFNLALALLHTGRWQEGWRELAHRERIRGVSARRWAGVPAWDGGRLPSGATLLLVAEQGLGDVIQFVRYAETARAQSGAQRLVLAAPTALHRLLREGLQPAHVIDEFWDLQRTAAASDVTASAPLMSLPALCGPAPDGIVQPPSPYLAPAPDRVARWASRLGPAPAHRLRVGFAWQGNPKYRADARRSLPLATLSPLLGVPAVQAFSLQKGAGAEQARAFHQALFPLADELDTAGDAFVDTAAVLTQLDLLITSDTALPHLAGALGRPVWLLLAHVPDWRWGSGGDRTPFYPTLRLFRQSVPGDWRGVVHAVEHELRRWARTLQR